MTLKETAFMVDLIKANYRRRMIGFLVNMVVIFIAIILVFLIKPSDNFMGFLQGISLIVAVLALVRMLLVYYSTDNQSDFPWSIRKRQMFALQETIKAKADFEDLGSSVPLQEYCWAD
jgi:hypothetical protein